jgi:uncharacterized protein YbjT (DUF2867 family)
MILITGATGSNGRELIAQLLAHGVAIRAMARKTPETPFPSEVQFVAGDFDNSESLLRALEGVDRAFLLTNSSEKVEEQQLRFATAARKVGLGHIVYLSQFHADPGSSVRFLRYHGRVEAAIRDAGLSYNFLRPNLYMQAILRVLRALGNGSHVSAPAGDCSVSVVDVRDIAAVAATTLCQDGHTGKIYTITGPEALTHHQIAAQISAVTGKRIDYMDIAEEQMRKGLCALGMPVWQAEGLLEDYAHYRRGEASEITSDVERVTGQKPRSFRTFLSECVVPR